MLQCHRLSFSPVALGDEVRDQITGFQGIVVSLTEWFNACQRANVQPPCEAGKVSVPVTEVFDVEQLTVITPHKIKRVHAQKIEAGDPNPGGPTPLPNRETTPRAY